MRRKFIHKSCVMTTALLKTAKDLSNEADANKPTYTDTASHDLINTSYSPHCFKSTMLQTLEAHIKHSLSATEGHEVTSAHLKDFRFHSSTQLLVAQGYYATACQLSMQRTIENIRLFPRMETQLTAFAPRQCNAIVGMDRYGDKYINAFDESHPQNDSYRVVADQFIQDHTLPDTLFRRIRHSAPGGAHIAKTFIHSPKKFEIFIDRTNTVYLREGSGQLIPIDTLSQPFRLANVCLNGRFVALITADGKVQRYDRETGQSQIVDLKGDREAITLSVSDDGTLYIGSRENTYIVAIHGNAVKKGPRLDRYNRIFSLSADERFLILQRKSTRGVDILLKDLRNNHREIILSRTLDKAHPYTNTPYSIAFSPLNAMVAVGYQHGVVEIFDLTQDSYHAKSLAGVILPQHSGITPHPIVSFSKGFDQLHILYRGHGNAVELNTLTFGATHMFACESLLSSEKLFNEGQPFSHIALMH